MNNTQNAKIAQVTNDTMVIGIDIGSQKHWARAFDNRGMELSKKAFGFNNTAAGFASFEVWYEGQRRAAGLKRIMVGLEPTGHYWFNLNQFLSENGIKVVLVAPQHVKHSKELDDNTQGKDDLKDPRVIAKLVTEGRYFLPYRPTGVYAELRDGFNRRCGIAHAVRNDGVADLIRDFVRMPAGNLFRCKKHSAPPSGQKKTPQAVRPRGIVQIFTLSLYTCSRRESSHKSDNMQGIRVIMTNCIWESLFFSMEVRLMKSLKKMIAVLLILLLVLGCTCSFAEGDEWVCPDCGAANTTNFCTKCGAQKPEEIVCPNCGTKYPIDSGTAFCGNCGTKLEQAASFSIKYEGEGFNTPEEALTCYMEGLKNLDFEQMLGAFAWETQIEHYDFKAYFERIRAYQSTMRPRMPSVNDFMFSANVNVTRFNQTDLIYRSLEQYILGDDSPSKQTTGSVIFQKDSDDVAVFLQKFENGRLEKLTQMSNIRFLSPDDVTEGKFSAGKNPEQFVKQTACYGADEAVNLVGVADVGDETLYCCPTICRYGDKWYLVSVSSFTSMFLGVPSDYQAFICGSGSLKSIIR